MITINEQRLKELATAYVEDGILKKWRFDNMDEDHIDSILNDKYYTGKPVTEDELEYILIFRNVVIINRGRVTFHNFTGSL